MTPRKLAPLEAIAKRLGVRPEYLHEKIKAGVVPYLRAGPAIMMNFEAVHELLLGLPSTSPKNSPDTFGGGRK